MEGSIHTLQHWCWWHDCKCKITHCMLNPPRGAYVVNVAYICAGKKPQCGGLFFFFFFLNWLEESTCRLSSAYCLPVWRKRARASRLRWKESSFCMFLHHFDTLTVGELKHGKSPVPSISSQCCWQLWQLTAWVCFVFLPWKVAVSVLIQLV